MTVRKLREAGAARLGTNMWGGSGGLRQWRVGGAVYTEAAGMESRVQPYIWFRNLVWSTTGALQSARQ